MCINYKHEIYFSKILQSLKLVWLLIYFVENFRCYRNTAWYVLYILLFVEYYCGSITYDQYGTLGAQWLLTLIAS